MLVALKNIIYSLATTFAGLWRRGERVGERVEVVEEHDHECEHIRSHRDKPERPWADPIYCAEMLSEAFLYLPTCEYFKSVFMWRTEQKLVNERIVQYKTATHIKPIYYVIDRDPEIYTSTCGAELAWHRVGNQWGAIYATLSHADAVERAEDV
ncbi:hypothetical protein DFH08DRAFT_978446 [Mycena albidolilacea]|uniref:Uncharacterized protein n=1 Tax=Mycena albidolilacea TaxID=1033008 RepID=A0AAD6YZ78_9AGAR|nr:hypothetical protein DFH08DRAFT_978446 [Mycena albidolilacea]